MPSASAISGKSSVEWLGEMQRNCGPDCESNPEYQFKVRGIFPTSAVDNLIGVGEFLDVCRRRAEEAPQAVATMGVDVARYGGDRTTIVVLRDGRILHAEAYGKQDVVFTAGRVMELAPRFMIGKNQAERIAIDDTGVGGGVVDVLHGDDWSVRGVNFGESPKRDEVAELAPAVREELRADLTTVKYSFRPDDRRILEPKEDIRKRIGRSPDYGDALALALALRTVRTRLGYEGISSDRSSYGGWEHPEDADHPGHERWVKDHAFDGLIPRGNPFRDTFPPPRPLDW